MANKIIAALFTIVYVALAFVLGLLGSFHAGSPLVPVFSMVLLVVAVAALWTLYFWLRRRAAEQHVLALLTGGVAIAFGLFAGCIGTFGLLERREFAAMERRAAATTVFDMRDEPLLSPHGNPIGIRLHYSMRFPDDNVFWQWPHAAPEQQLNLRTWSDMRLAAKTVDPAMLGVNPQRYQAGKVYRFTADLLPPFIVTTADGARTCIGKPSAADLEAFEEFLRRTTPGPYRVTVSGTQYSGLTSNHYSAASFYESAVKDAMPGCKYRNGVYVFD
jgi:hypothetical protein